MAKDNKGNKYYSLVVPNPDPENLAEDQSRQGLGVASYDQAFGPVSFSNDHDARLKQIAERTEAIKLFNTSRDYKTEKKKHAPIPMDRPLSFSLGLQSPDEMGSQNSDEDEFSAIERLSNDDLEWHDIENYGDIMLHDLDPETLHKRLQDQGPLEKDPQTSFGFSPLGFFRRFNLFSSGKGDKYQQVQDDSAEVPLANPLSPRRSVINSDQNPGKRINPLEKLGSNQSYKTFPKEPLSQSISRVTTKKPFPFSFGSYVADGFNSVVNGFGAVLGMGKDKSRISPVEVKSEDVTAGEVEGSIVSSPAELDVDPEHADPFKLEIKPLSGKNKIAEINRILDVPAKSIGVVTVKKAIEEVEGKQEVSHAGSIKDTKYRNAALDILGKTFQELNSSVVTEDDRITGADVAIFVVMMHDFIDQKIKGNPNEVGKDVGFKAWRDEMKEVLDNPESKADLSKIKGVGEDYELNSEKLISKFANISKTIQKQSGKYFNTVHGRKYANADLGARSFRIVQLLPDPFEVDLASLVDKAGSVIKSR